MRTSHRLGKDMRVSKVTSTSIGWKMLPFAVRMKPAPLASASSVASVITSALWKRSWFQHASSVYMFSKPQSRTRLIPDCPLRGERAGSWQ